MLRERSEVVGWHRRCLGPTDTVPWFACRRATLTGCQGARIVPSAHAIGCLRTLARCWGLFICEFEIAFGRKPPRVSAWRLASNRSTTCHSRGAGASHTTLSRAVSYCRTAEPGVRLRGGEQRGGGEGGHQEAAGVQGREGCCQQAQEQSERDWGGAAMGWVTKLFQVGRGGVLPIGTPARKGAS